MRTHELAKKITRPGRIKTYSGVPEGVEKWEMLIREFEASSETPLPEAIKQGALKSLIPEEMEADINRLSTELSDFKKMREYVLSQAAQRREPFFDTEPTIEQKNIKGPQVAHLEDGGGYGKDHLEESAVETMALQGEFPGFCHTCGQWGHRVNRCPLKDIQMKAMRDGKGKGKDGNGGKGDGKGLKGKGGFFGNYPYGYNPKGKGKGPSYYGGGPMQWGHGTKGGFGGGYGYGKGGVGKSYSQAFMVDSEGDAFVMNLTHHMNTDNIVCKNRFCHLSPTEEEDDTKLVDEKAWPMLREGKESEELPKKMPPWTKVKSQKDQKKERMRMRKSLEAEEKELNFLTVFEGDPEIQHMGEGEMVWVKVKSVMDTGAAESVAPSTLACHLPIHETQASRRGAEFQTAGGGKIVNQGERIIPSCTDSWQPVEMKYSVVDVIRPLNAVSQICDRGNEVTFTKDGGYIWNAQTNNVIHFPREKNVYVLETWTQMPRASVQETGFTRQER